MTPPARAIWRDYLITSAGANVAWEALQLPFYRIWQDASAGANAFAVVHCTLGDLVIAAAAFAFARHAAGGRGWPRANYTRVAAVAITIGLAYTVFSEWLNVGVRLSWTYSAIMPRVPPLGTGVTPLLQWLVVPALGFAVAKPGPPPP